MNSPFNHDRLLPDCYKGCPDADQCLHSLMMAAVNRNLARAKLEAILNSEGIANGTTDSS